MTPPSNTGCSAAAFALLARDDVPVLVDYPEAIGDEADSPLSCTLPPRHDPTLSPSVDEALALLPAYERARARGGAHDASTSSTSWS